MDNRIVIFDTTLRDGEQSPGCSMNTEEKLEVARQLSRLGVDVIEAGFPISSVGDFEGVTRVAQEVRGPVICGLSRCNMRDIDRAWEALRHAERGRIHTFIATSAIHMTHKLKKSPDEVLKMAVEAVRHAASMTPDVEFSAEDYTRSDPAFLAEILAAVIEAGATTINLPDTVGYTIPDEYTAKLKDIQERVPQLSGVTLSVHCHNDLGLAVANSLAAISAGVRQVECTVNGLGERAGNCAMEEVVMALRTRHDRLPYVTNVRTEEIYRTSRLVSDITGMPVQPNKAIIGANAFAHEAGIHQHGVIQERTTYEIMDPASIGLTANNLVLGKHSGRHAFEKRLVELGFTLNREAMEKAFARFKDLCDKKKIVADADLEAIVADEVYTVPEEFTLEHLGVMTSQGGMAAAAIRMRQGDTVIEETATGVGTVDAVFRTIDRIAGIPHTLEDYLVQAITGGTDALAEVTVRIRDNGQLYTGRSAHLDIVQASGRAYLQAINKLVYYRRTRAAAPPAPGMEEPAGVTGV